MPPLPRSMTVKKTSNYRKDGGLTKCHARILTILSQEAAPITHDRLSTMLAAKHPKTVRWALGCIRSAGRDPFSLMAKGFVLQESRYVEEGLPHEHVYSITKMGLAALEEFCSRTP